MNSCRTIALASVLVTGCIVENSDHTTETTSSLLADRAITLRTAVGAQFVAAENGGGAAINANRPTAGTWETFTLHDLNGGTLDSGDLVTLQSLDGHFVCAENGGGGVVNATRLTAQDWETFRVVKLGGTGATINDGDQIALQTKTTSQFLSAINGGGAGIVADRATASGWEAFVVGGGAGGGGGGGGGGGPSEFAPYFYTWGWGSGSYAFSSLTQMKSQGGPAAVTIAFVLAGNGCNASTEINNNLGDVRSYIAAGGHVKASFGGALGTYLEYNCATAGDLAGALTRFVDATGVTDLDFDLEQGARSSNASLNQRRGQALRQLQVARPSVRVAFTLPIAPNGLLQESIDIVQAAVNAGVQVSFVNGMTMDYGDGTDLGTVPVQSMEALVRQVRTLMPQLTLEQAYRKIGAVAMIGRNDDNETFSIANANTLIAYARQHAIGLVSFWAIQRDQVCPGGTTDLDRCSRSNSSLFQFSRIFAGATTP